MKAVATKSVEQQTAAPQSITIPQLAEGEHYAGIIIENGRISHHLVLLPGELASGTWKKSIDWAKKKGGELPTRSEQALLYANLKTQFQSSWYWSGEQYAPDDGYAWCQNFGYGYQNYYRKNGNGRARAVRRLPI